MCIKLKKAAKNALAALQTVLAAAKKKAAAVAVAILKRNKKRTAFLWESRSFFMYHSFLNSAHK